MSVFRRFSLFVCLFISCLLVGMKVCCIYLSIITRGHLLIVSDIPRTGAVHGSQGYIIILIAMSLSAIDIISTARRLLVFIRAPNKSLKTFWRCILNKEVEDIRGSEYDALIPNGSEEYISVKAAHDSDELGNGRNNNADAHEAGQWTNTTRQHRRQRSIRQIILSRRALYLVGHSAFGVIERFLVFAGFAQLLLGIVTYTGKPFVFRRREWPFTVL